MNFSQLQLMNQLQSMQLQQQLQLQKSFGQAQNQNTPKSTFLTNANMQSNSALQINGQNNMLFSGQQQMPVPGYNELSTYLTTLPSNQFALLNLMQTGTQPLNTGFNPQLYPLGNFPTGNYRTDHNAYGATSSSHKKAPTTFKQTGISKKLKTLSASEVMTRNELRKRVQLRMLNKNNAVPQNGLLSNLQTSTVSTDGQPQQSPFFYGLPSGNSPKKLGKNLSTQKHKQQAQAVSKALQLSKIDQMQMQNNSDKYYSTSRRGTQNLEDLLKSPSTFLTTASPFLTLAQPITPMLDTMPTQLSNFSDTQGQTASQNDLSSLLSPVLVSPMPRFSFLEVFSPSQNSSTNTLDNFLSAYKVGPPSASSNKDQRSPNSL